jgi:hypothetical protein
MSVIKVVRCSRLGAAQGEQPALALRRDTGN